MSVSLIVNVELTGVATVTFKRTVQMSKWKAKKILADDNAMQKMLMESKNIDVTEWDLVYGQRQGFESTNEHQKARAV